MAFWIMGRSQIPRSELGPARGPMPLLPNAPVRMTIAAPGMFIGRTLQREALDLRREIIPAAPAGDGARISPEFLARLGNIAGNIFNNLARAALLQAAGPAAPIAARVIPAFRIIPPVTTPVAQPERTIDPPASAIEREAIHTLPASGGRVTELSPEGIATIQVDTVQGPKTIEVEVPFPEAGFPREAGF